MIDEIVQKMLLKILHASFQEVEMRPLFSRLYTGIFYSRIMFQECVCALGWKGF